MAFVTIFLLALLEVALSFDNAIVNATVLRDTPPIWRRRFLSWGLPAAVLGMRLTVPVLIIYAASHISLIEIAKMAFYNPGEYAAAIQKHHNTIAAFGGTFLLMVFLQFVFDKTKEVHWIAPLEKQLVKFGHLESIEICIVLLALLLLPNAPLGAGIFGLFLFILTKSLLGMCDDPGLCVEKHKGLARFFYLEILDASFSLDGVVGAFAITDNIWLIMIGLGIGALIIRSITLYFVKEGTLKQFIYLEHGAYWGIGALGTIMLYGIVEKIPPVVPGFLGGAIIALSLFSSLWRET